ncbi:H/ACA snoRNP pseudouridylase subunit [Perkinsus chesapeaki]|uniref:H/ACA snoRNP pseudouridylase subunit n=1 Tax=Perkinsus chesapeaki TaxID=330153 RepID=A0A7J6L236_PERCH|nr:H/ACA snoRNP pseudouridylase subunit [Perkinsus chesapeaki]
MSIRSPTANEMPVDGSGPSFANRSTSSRNDDEFSPAYYFLKVYVGGLPRGMLTYFSRYGSVADTWLYRSSDPTKMNLPPYGFVTFRNAADADAAVVSEHEYHGSHTLQVNYATMKKSISSSGSLESTIPSGSLDDSAIGSVSASATTFQGATEADLGEFFSQWGLVLLILTSPSDPSSCFVQYSAREGALRLLAEQGLSFKGATVSVTQRNVSANLGYDDKTLIRRATDRHMALSGRSCEGSTDISLLNIPTDPPQLPKLRGYEFDKGRLMAGRPHGDTTVPITTRSSSSKEAVLRPRGATKSGENSGRSPPRNGRRTPADDDWNDEEDRRSKRARRGSASLSRSRRRNSDRVM